MTYWETDTKGRKKSDWRSGYKPTTEHKKDLMKTGPIRELKATVKKRQKAKQQKTWNY